MVELAAPGPLVVGMNVDVYFDGNDSEANSSRSSAVQTRT